MPFWNVTVTIETVRTILFVTVFDAKTVFQPVGLNFSALKYICLYFIADPTCIPLYFKKLCRATLISKHSLLNDSADSLRIPGTSLPVNSKPALAGEEGIEMNSSQFLSEGTKDYKYIKSPIYKYGIASFTVDHLHFYSTLARFNIFILRMSSFALYSLLYIVVMKVFPYPLPWQAYLQF